MEKAEKEQLLRELYYEREDTKYRSPLHLWELAKEENPNISKHFVKEWLLGQASYTRFKKWNHPKHFRKTFTRDFDQLQMDLVILSKYKEENDGYQNLLMAIDILSRYGFCVPLKNKSGLETLRGIKKVLEEYLDRFGKYPKYVQFDEGKEFLNRDTKKYFEEMEIQYFYTYSPRKATVVERLNRTIKTKMDRMFLKHKNHNWVDYIGGLMKSYNGSKHRGIGMKPKDVNEENKFSVWISLYGKLMDIRRPRYKVGDKVRVLNLNIQHRVAQLESRYTKRAEKKIESEKLFGDYFKEKYRDEDPERVAKSNAEQHAINIKRPPFSDEIFRIVEVKLGDPVVYKLWSDEFNREIKGIFYDEELSLVKE